MEENFCMKWNMEWKKIDSMEYGKFVFHSIPCSASRKFVDSRRKIMNLPQNWGSRRNLWVPGLKTFFVFFFVFTSLSASRYEKSLGLLRLSSFSVLKICGKPN